MICKMPPTSPEAVRRLEEAIHIRIPEDYRKFLLKYNGGGPDETNYCFPKPVGNQSGVTISLFFPLEGWRITIEEEVKNYKGRVPRNLLPFGSDDSGNLFCLGLEGKSSGKVFFWDHEQEKAAFELIGEPVPEDVRQENQEKFVSDGNEYTGNVFFVANSFEEFANNLTSFPEELG